MATMLFKLVHLNGVCISVVYRVVHIWKFCVLVLYDNSEIISLPFVCLRNKELVTVRT